MGFFAPWFLAGLVGIGLPVWLHLLKQHRQEPKPFASLMFFERRTQSSVKHRRLLYKLLMALRIALIALLALLFAEPYFRQAAATGGKKLLIGVIDHTFSMHAGTLLGRAKSEIASAVGKRGAGDDAQVLALGRSVEVLTQATQDPEVLKAAVESIPPGDGRASYGDLARYLRTLSASVKVPIEVHFASDFQKSELPAVFSDMQLPENVTLVPHRVSSGKNPNFAVESVTAPGSISDPKKVRVAATIRAYETDAVTRKNVSLSVNGKVLKTMPVDVPVNGRARVEFSGLEASYGLNRGEVSIDGNDALEADNHFRFGFDRAEPRKILLAFDARQARAVTYYKAALDAAGDSPFTVEPVPCDITAGQAPSKYAFVVLADCSNLPGPFEQALTEYVKQGGSVLMTLGPASGSREKTALTGIPVEASRVASRESEIFMTAAQVDGGHPVTQDANAFDGVRFYQFVRLNPASASRVIAKVSDGSPLLVETTMGEGKVLTFASTIDNLSNDFPLHPSFVPFIERSAAYLGGSLDKPSSTVVGETIELRSAKSAATVEVLGNDGKPALSLAEAAAARSFTLASEGFYEIRRSGAKPEFYAVNADRRESDLETLPQETIDLWKATGKPDPNSQTGIINSEQIERERAWNPWRWILFILLLVVAAEALIGSRYLGTPSDKVLEPTQKEAA